MATFSKKQIAVLKRLADQEITLTEVIHLTRKATPISFRLDTGLIAAMKKRAESEGINTSELVRQAVAVYLSGT